MCYIYILFYGMWWIRKDFFPRCGVRYTRLCGAFYFLKVGFVHWIVCLGRDGWESRCRYGLVVFLRGGAGQVRGLLDRFIWYVYVAFRCMWFTWCVRYGTVRYTEFPLRKSDGRVEDGSWILCRKVLVVTYNSLVVVIWFGSLIHLNWSIGLKFRSHTRNRFVT